MVAAAAFAHNACAQRWACPPCSEPSVVVTVNKTACPRRPIRRRHDGAWNNKGSTTDVLYLVCLSWRPLWVIRRGLVLSHPHGRGSSAVSGSESRGAFWALCTVPREVEFLDRCKTDRSESAGPVRLRQSRTRVWGSKMIRYRR